MGNGQNVNFFPWNDIPEDNVFPTGVFHMTLHEVEDGTAGSGKRMIRAQFLCKAPAEFAGMMHFENYVLGTEENPTGVNNTMGARQFKKMLSRAQVPPSNDIAALCASAKGAELLLTINMYTEKEGQYAGSLRNRVADYHRLGERNVGIAPKTGSAPGQGAVPSAPVGFTPPVGGMPMSPAPTGGVAPSFAPPVASAPVMQPSPTQVYQAPPPPAPAPMAPPVNMQPPAQQFTQPAAPVAPAPMAPMPAQAPATGIAPTTAPEAGMAIRCSICQQDVPVSQYGMHIQQHAQMVR